MMTRKDFEKVARTLKLELETAVAFDEPHGAKAIVGVAHALAADFSTMNPRFDAQRFLAACGVEDR